MIDQVYQPINGWMINQVNQLIPFDRPKRDGLSNRRAAKNGTDRIGSSPRRPPQCHKCTEHSRDHDCHWSDSAWPPDPGPNGRPGWPNPSRTNRWWCSRKGAFAREYLFPPKKTTARWNRRNRNGVWRIMVFIVLE